MGAHFLNNQPKLHCKNFLILPGATKLA